MRDAWSQGLQHSDSTSLIAPKRVEYQHQRDIAGTGQFLDLCTRLGSPLQTSFVSYPVTVMGELNTKCSIYFPYLYR